MTPLSEQELEIHTCLKCKNNYNLEKVIKYYPVISFGTLKDKPLLVVGLNPSAREYEDGYILSSPDPETRHKSQMTYFDSGFYGFFNKVEQFFQGTAKKAIGWEKKPWEKVGFTDLAKCPTRRNDGQWSALTPTQKRAIIKNCQRHLFNQIKELKPKLIIAYGTDVCRWFYPKYHRDNNAYTNITWRDKIPVILVPQNQSNYPKPVIRHVQNLIAEVFS